MTGDQPRVRVLRVIARLNIGGPARHVTILDRGLRARGFETLLAHGELGPGEGSLEQPLREAAYPRPENSRTGQACQPDERSPGVCRSAATRVYIQAGRGPHPHGQSGHPRTRRRVPLQLGRRPRPPLHRGAHLSRARFPRLLRSARQPSRALVGAAPRAHHRSHARPLAAAARRNRGRVSGSPRHARFRSCRSGSSSVALLALDRDRRASVRGIRVRVRRPVRPGEERAASPRSVRASARTAGPTRDC